MVCTKTDKTSIAEIATIALRKMLYRQKHFNVSTAGKVDSGYISSSELSVKLKSFKKQK